MRRLLVRLRRPAVIVPIGLLFVLGLVAWAYWMGIAAAP